MNNINMVHTSSVPIIGDRSAQQLDDAVMKVHFFN